MAVADKLQIANPILLPNQEAEEGQLEGGEGDHRSDRKDGRTTHASRVTAKVLQIPADQDRRKIPCISPPPTFSSSPPFPTCVPARWRRGKLETPSVRPPPPKLPPKVAPLPEQAIHCRKSYSEVSVKETWGAEGGKGGNLMSAVTYKNDCWAGGGDGADGGLGAENALPNEFASSSNTDEWR